MFQSKKFDDLFISKPLLRLCLRCGGFILEIMRAFENQCTCSNLVRTYLICVEWFIPVLTPSCRFHFQINEVF